NELAKITLGSASGANFDWLGTSSPEPMRVNKRKITIGEIRFAPGISLFYAKQFQFYQIFYIFAGLLVSSNALKPFIGAFASSPCAMTLGINYGSTLGRLARLMRLVPLFH